MKSKFDWRAAYFHVVSLVAMIVFIFAAISIGHGLLMLAWPTLSMNQHDWERVQSFEAFKWGKQSPPVPRNRDIRSGSDSVISQEAMPSDEDLRREWRDQKALLIAGQWRRGLWNLVQSLATLLVVLPVLWWHRRATKRLKDSALTEHPG